MPRTKTMTVISARVKTTIRTALQCTYAHGHHTTPHHITHAQHTQHTHTSTHYTPTHYILNIHTYHTPHTQTSSQPLTLKRVKSLLHKEQVDTGTIC